MKKMFASLTLFKEVNVLLRSFSGILRKEVSESITIASV